MEQSSSKRLLFIVNPVSGRRKALPHVPEIEQIFRDGGYEVTTLRTGCRGDAVQFAAEYGPDFDLIVCLGGDGTLNEVSTGLALKNREIPVGYIPAGSTNDFGATHGLSTNIIEAANNIISKEIVCSDLGKINDRYFTYVAAFGAFAALSYATSQNLKNKIGHAAYMLGVFKELTRLKSHYMKFTNEDGEVYEGKFLFCTVCNSTSVAGVFELPKDMVVTDDGKFEAILIRQPKSLGQFMKIVKAMFSQQYSISKNISVFQTSRIHVESDENTDWSIDGEYVSAPESFDIVNMAGFLHLKG